MPPARRTRAAPGADLALVPHPRAEAAILGAMHACEVIDVLDALDDLGVHHWLDGGWGVDCLLGEQTRPHGDLGLVVPRGELERVAALLVSSGYAVIRDWLPTTLAFRDDQGREVDVHPVDPTDDGGGDQVLLDGESRWHYAPPTEGTILGRAVRCSSPHDQLLMHLGYEPRATDVADVHRLAERFGLHVPAPLRGPDDGAGGRESREKGAPGVGHHERRGAGRRDGRGPL